MPVLSVPQRPRLLQDFLIPHLNNKTFGDKLYWMDRGNRIFAMFWIHQSSSRFVTEDSIVFKEWAKMKNLWNPQTNGALTKAKQRVRAALLKLKNVRCIKKEPERRIYQITSQNAFIEENDEASMTETNCNPLFQDQWSNWENYDMTLSYFDTEEREINWFINRLLKT